MLQLCVPCVHTLLADITIRLFLSVALKHNSLTLTWIVLVLLVCLHSKQSACCHSEHTGTCTVVSR